MGGSHSLWTNGMQLDQAVDGFGDRRLLFAVGQIPSSWLDGRLNILMDNVNSLEVVSQQRQSISRRIIDRCHHQVGIPSGFLDNARVGQVIC